MRARLPVGRLADSAAVGMILGQALGRFACIPNGDAYGAPANLPWAFIYTNPHAFIPAQFLAVPTHPYPVYEMLFDFAVLGLLWRLHRERRHPYVAVAALGEPLHSTRDRRPSDPANHRIGRAQRWDIRPSPVCAPGRAERFLAWIARGVRSPDRAL